MSDIHVDNVFVLFGADGDTDSSSSSASTPSPVFLTVEHASSRIPEPWPQPSSSDAALLNQHWGIDLGAETLARELAVKLSETSLDNTKPGRSNVRGIAARFSRLLCDANRNLDEDERLEREFRAGARDAPGTMMRRTCEDGKVVVEMNEVGLPHLDWLERPGMFSFLILINNRPRGSSQNLTLEDRQNRILVLYNPYHAAIRAHLSNLQRNLDPSTSPPILVFSIHSFTDLYESKKRTLEVGVLYRDPQDEPLAGLMNAKLVSAGFVSAINEPWSGKEGFMHSANMHARELGVPKGSNDERNEARALMIEARQDLLTGDVEWRRKLVQVVCESIRDWYAGM